MAPSWFFVSVADKGLSVGVSGLESTVAGGCVSVDSKRVCRPCGGGSGGRSGARRRPYLGQVAEWMGRSAVGCRAGRSAQPTERLGLTGGDEILRSADPSGALKARYAQDGSRGKRVWGGKRVFVGRELKLEIGRGKRKKKIPRSANSPGGQSPRCGRNDNSRGFRRAARRVVGLGLVAGRAKLCQ